MDLIRLAERQHSLLTKEQLLRAGVSERAITHRVQAGRLVRVVRGVYRLPGSRHVRERSLLAAQFAIPGAVLSHRSAAWVWSMSGVAPIRPELTLPPGRTSSLNVARVYRRILAKEDVTANGPFRLTRPSRTLYDLAAVLAEEALEFAVDDAATRGLVGIMDLLQRVSPPQRGVPGIAALRRIVEDRAANGTPGSHLETRAVRAMRKARLPRAVSQFTITAVDGTFVATVDLALPDRRLAIELDGDTYHSTKQQRQKDRVRQNDLVAEGWAVLRFDDEAVRTGVFCRSLLSYLRNA